MFAELLLPIEESERGVDRGMDYESTNNHQPRSRTSRSVRFAVDERDIPAQPPSSPNQSEDQCESLPLSPSQLMGASMTVHYSETSQQDLDGLMVIGRGQQKPDLQGPSNVSPATFNRLAGANAVTPSLSPEPWPQV